LDRSAQRRLFRNPTPPGKSSFPESCPSSGSAFKLHLQAVAPARSRSGEKKFATAVYQREDGEWTYSQWNSGALILFQDK
jgi:hypothetical protein